MLKLTFITGNAKKAEQLAYHLDYTIEHKKLDLVEIQSLDLDEIVTDKAKRAYEILKSPVLVEDTSLTFKALGKLPGPLIKWFLTELNNEGLCKILDGYKNRDALAEVRFGLYDGKQMHLFAGSIEGTIADSPRGEDGFGWDPIFIPKGYTKTWGEMNMQEQTETSMRKIALKKLQRFLELNHAK